MTVSIICITIFAITLLSLGVVISLKRFFGGQFYFNAYPDPTDFLSKLVRAHGNTAEFAPMLSLMIYYLGTVENPAWVCWSIILVTASRLLVVVGFLTSATLEKMSFVKAVGAVGTYLFGLSLAYACLAHVLH